ncbi:hypothetical protein ASPVEDRAFT_185266 [Aspergillus versicolor CBS 583.65]|uniref:Major facilitator superfamily (MFS) profile domain-containing protein n=1 Tax=Aspergillus versicolor CBS 583.65 TaxID=1036611 RepID=A0A1L9P976_ASPVE|nr:uncharacterized protein ASPVEDRAFT_185266 [Aspergillus versicolor CBS 583.65]OJI98048.1 hypothetical protein ASPVEDRAFT_185266 [Aspergillus versicolor CBS 583.65]
MGTGEQAKDAPDGGLRAWIVATGGCAAQMCTFGYINTFGTYQSYYTQSLTGSSPSSISWIGSSQTFLLYFLGIISGPLSDRFGVRAAIVPGSILLIASVMATSVSIEYYQIILAQGILGGIGNGFIFTPAMSCVGQYFTASRAWAMGIGISGGAVGGVLFPIMLQKLIPKVGFGWAVRAIGFLLLVVAGCMCTAMKEFAPRRKRGWLIPGAWKQKSYVLVNMAFLLALMGCYTPLFYVVEYGLSHGMDSALAWRQVAIINAASFFGRLIPNFLGDRLGRINMSIVCYTACAVLCLCWTTATSTAGITVWNVAYGFFSGAIFSLFAPVVAQVCPNLGDIGTYIGQGSTLCSFGALVGTPVSGVLIRNYGYFVASLFSALTIFAGACCLGAARLLFGKALLVVV